MGSLFERIGGKEAVSLAVDQFYEKVLADPRINYFFEQVDMSKQKKHLYTFIAYAFGGLPSYSGQSMRKAHKEMVDKKGLSGEHFDAVIENFGAALVSLNVPQELIVEAAAIAQSTRKDVLNQ